MKDNETPAECVARIHREVERARARLEHHESSGPDWNRFLLAVERAVGDYLQLNLFEEHRYGKTSTRVGTVGAAADSPTAAPEVRLL